MIKKLKHLLIGTPLADSELGNEKFNIFWGIPVFASDAISSVSYAGEEILLVLIPVLGMLSYRFFLPIVAAIIGLLVILIFCYRQTIAAYPQGGGAYIVAHENLGQTPGLVAGGALIIGYVLTVAVSACAGAAAITSAFPQLLKYKALLAFAIISLLTWGNLRGLRESSVMFGVPTYIFILTMITLIVTGLIKYALGLYTPEQQVVAVQQAEDTLMFVMLRAFASGCTALTGVEAVSNGVPNFKEPTVKNAKTVLYAMAGFVALVFFGVSALINLYQIQPNSEATAVSQLAGAVFGRGSAMFFVVQIMTVIILALAANTAYAGMPLLTALMAKDGFLPRRLVTRGARLNFSNGILFLFASSSILVFAFNGDQHLLLPLYASGVFISFLLNQYGMVVHWIREKGNGWKIKAIINGFGTVVTGITLVVIVIVKFLSGAWVTLICIIALVYMMRKIRKHYVTVAEDLRIESTQKAKEVIRNVASGKVILPIQSLNRSFLKTLNCALGCGFTEVEIYHISDNKERAEALKASIGELGLNAVFHYDITPYRNMNEVLLKHVEEEADKLGPNRSLVIMMGMLVVTKQLEKPLHNQTTQRLMKELETYHNVSVFTVPYLI
ncbi:MAG: APC family permease [Spirochaetia bacterium]|nr:APC family permease [Bacteroidaceae bacterium]MBO7093621.1 APC family permease [Spirochaetia bacterium]